jgi:hypothetical protein
MEASAACETGGTPPISALTNAFSLGSNRGHRTDDFGPRFVARPTVIEEESSHLRKVVKRVRQVIARTRAGIGTPSRRFRTFLDQGSATANKNRHELTQESNHLRASFDDFSVEVIARGGRCEHYAGLLQRVAMSLQTRRPPGHAKRKALTYAADIANLRAQGHSYSAIREALEDAGVLVSISTVRREVLKGLSTTAAPKPAVDAPAPQVGLATRGKATSAVAAPHPAPSTTPLPGKAIAEEFMRDRSTNTLFLKESSR